MPQMIVEIPNVGPVEFPESMSEQEIAEAAGELYDQWLADELSRDIGTIPGNQQIGAVSQQIERPAVTRDAPAQNMPDLNANQAMDQTLAEAQQRGAEMMRGESPAALGRFAMRQLFDNILGTPRALGTLTADASVGLQTAGESVGRLMRDEPVNFMQNFRENQQDQMDVAAQLREQGAGPGMDVTSGLASLRNIPRADTFDIEAGVAAGLDVLSGQAKDGFASAFERRRGELVEDLLQAREAAPVSAAVGSGIADAATVLGMRSPIVRARRTRIINEERAGKVPDAPEIPTHVPGPTEAAIDWGDRLIRSAPVQATARGAYRTAGAGMESMIMAAIQDDDPLAAAAVSAGSQAIGGAVLATAKGSFSSWPRFAGSLFAVISLHQLAKEALPGDRERILESTESGYLKMLMLLGAGAISAGIGSGRMNPTTRGALETPTWVDAMYTLPRGTAQSFVRDLLEADDDEFVYNVFYAMIDDPDSFGPTAQRRMQRAIDSDGEIGLLETIEDLRADPDFRRRISQIQGDR